MVRDLHQRFNVICRLANCRDKINCDDLQTYCTETNVLFVQAFPWKDIPDAVHMVIGHISDVIRWNNGFGLAQYSEQGMYNTIH